MDSDSLTVLLYAALLSALILAFCSAKLVRAKAASEPSCKNLSKHGGATALLCSSLRVLACSTLLGLSVASSFNNDAYWKLQLALGVFYLYASLLAAAAIFSSVAKAHLDFILSVAFIVYFYRDILPLGTYTWPIQDAAEGRVLLAKIIVLTVAAVMIPLVTPRTYIPVDPLQPMPIPNPEQTASPLSLLSLSFLDPLVLLAYRLPHLSFDLLPPLADTDYSQNLKARGFPNLDPFSGAGKRHIVLGILKTFRTDFVILIFTIFIYLACMFAAPIGINRVLAYLEDGPSTSEFRPFVWIIWLALGPLASSIAMQAYFRMIRHISVQLESLLTELIFEHALRVRVKAQNPDADNGPSEASVGADASRETLNSTSNSKKAVNSSIDLGRINNLISTDLRNLTELVQFPLLLFHMPASIVISLVFLYQILGWSSFVGMAAMAVLLPFFIMVSGFLQAMQKGRIKAADARIGTITEMMNVLRMIKLFGWEGKMLERVNVKREAELGWIWQREFFEVVANNINGLILIVTMVLTYSTFVNIVVMKQELRPSIVFGSLPVLEIIRTQLFSANYQLIQFIDAKVSIDRINDFLHNTEVLDSFIETEAITEATPELIGFRDASFTWSNESDGSATPSRRNFVLHVEGELLFKPKCINLILGPTGAGKTSLLMALLGEMHFVPLTPSSWFHLPRAGGVAYAAQESWVLNETIRDNILFGAEYDDERYKKVIHQCALERDLELFDAGGLSFFPICPKWRLIVNLDASEVGERGLTLSMGQKARITLARAIYSTAEILLLDDVLAALEYVSASSSDPINLTSVFIPRNGSLKSALETHNVALAATVADFTVSIGVNGRILSQGSVSEALQNDITLAEEANAEVEQLLDPESPKKEPVDGKLILAEEVKIGNLRWSAVRLYLRGLRGWLYPGLLLFPILFQLAQVLETWYLGYFASLYETGPSSSVSVAYHMGIYGLILFFDIITHWISDMLFALALMCASRSIHLELIKSILGTTFRWLDTTPSSRVIARFTGDMASVDAFIPFLFGGLIYNSIAIILSLGAVVLLTPVLLIPGLCAAIVGGAIGQLFAKAQLSVKRESSTARAPVLGHFSAAISGLPSIRAYGSQAAFVQESLRRINKYTRTARTLGDLERWVGVRLAVVGNLLAAIIAIYLVYFRKDRANNVGFSLAMSAAFSMRILQWVRMFNDAQIQGNCLERIQQLIDIEQEPKPTEAGKPPAHWPSSGELIVEKLSARYSPDGPKVLHDISFRVNPGERIGIVGRTGSGKSSLTLALLRSIYTEGIVYYDGIPTSSVNLDALRSNITIIPQIPELLSGSLRHNLDPFDQYDDLTLNNALRAAGLFSLQDEMEEGRLVLDTIVSSGGSNLSVGQRQILALARAIVRDSKILILDEATSAIDYQTDNVIQASLRNELKPDVTVLTVAHRLQTILDSDKIMVLDEGRIVEFDSPNVLLQNPKGKLRALVDESKDRDRLYAMAQQGGR
ncbi:multidrug resistance-associated ABC transporter [Roridomyces roridus]|uniref:Multidrug resistance-associated ABC transporter n=1 Tax=Roridomyces roridus TaxID=1738132 RepID=A0AAD7CL40_9AGAR|nr:multidrug resistance-associated ABC transporter [Roridomyces roridus]